jgi:hypothetical protein
VTCEVFCTRSCCLSFSIALLESSLAVRPGGEGVLSTREHATLQQAVNRRIRTDSAVVNASAILHTDRQDVDPKSKHPSSEAGKSRFHVQIRRCGD